MEDKKISDMAELLCKGARMLSHYCPDCKVPLFREGTRVFCPSCGRDVVMEGRSEKDNIPDKPDDKPAKPAEQKEGEQEGQGGLEAVRKAIDKLLQELDRKDDAESIKELVDTIYKAVEIFEKLRKLY